MTAKRPAQQRLDELLADRALEGLSPEATAELSALLEGAEDPSFDHAAAAVALATSDLREALPAQLAAKIEAEAMGALASPKDTSFLRVKTGVEAAPPPRVSRLSRVSGWLAAAACLALALAGWLRPAPQPTTNPPPIASSVASSAPSLAAPAPPPDRSTQRDRLLAEEGTVHLDWSATKDPGGRGATGDVVWSSRQQAGFMRFHGLAANDPAKSQYQLWIFDPSQSDKTPIDGGVFDVETATGDVLVPITPKLHVTAPTLFAITIEKPGGVVVSKRQHIVVVAAVKG